MNRIQRSVALVKQSFEVLRSNTQLLWFPVVSSMFTIALMASFAVPLFLTSGLPQQLAKGGWSKMEHAHRLPPQYFVVFGLFYLCSYFIVIFFNVALVSCAHASLKGETMSFGDGIRAAWKKLPAILGWTVIAATIGMILQMISERSGIIGKIVVVLVGGAWNLITFFVIPIIAVEQGSPIEAIKKSGSMLKRTWGENLAGSFGMGIVFFLYALAPVFPIVAAFAFGGPYVGLLVVLLSILYWLLLGVVASSLTGIYRAALYVYAETGTVGAFGGDAMQNAFRQGKPNMVTKLRDRF